MLRCVSRLTSPHAMYGAGTQTLSPLEGEREGGAR